MYSLQDDLSLAPQLLGRVLERSAMAPDRLRLYSTIYIYIYIHTYIYIYIYIYILT